MSPRRKPDLDQLIAALTAEGRPDELAGRDAARTAFRAANQRAAAEGADRRRHGVPFRRPMAALSARLLALGAAVAVTAGVAAAAYAQALPVPVQRLAHTVFAPLGVPNGQQPHTQPAPAAISASGTTGVTIATSGGQSPQATSGVTPLPASSSPSPRATQGYVVTVAASRVRVSASGVVAFTGRVTDGGRAVTGVRVQLYERIAGTLAERLVATGVTGPLGGFRLLSPPLTATAVFRVAGPGGTHSTAVRITVVPVAVRARLP